MQAVWGFYAFLIGSIIGSFLNVVIHRYPREESVVFPPSRCPNCHHRIRWYDNVPVLSWIILRGRCRDCRAPINVRYPLVEAANGLFYLALYNAAGLSPFSILLAASVSATIALIFIDAEIQILPDVIDIPGIVIGLLVGLVAPLSAVRPFIVSSSLLDSVLGGLAGAALLLAIALAYRLVRRIEGMGMGDVKMLAMIGATVGLRPLFAVMLVASVAGAATGLSIAAIRRSANLQFALPFGVFLGLAFLTVVFFGRTLFTAFPALGLGL